MYSWRIPSVGVPFKAVGFRGKMGCYGRAKMTALTGEARSAHMLRDQNVAFYPSVERKNLVHDTDFFARVCTKTGQRRCSNERSNRHVRVVRVVTDMISPRRESVDALTNQQCNRSQKFRSNISSANLNNAVQLGPASSCSLWFMRQSNRH